MSPMSSSGKDIRCGDQFSMQLPEEGVTGQTAFDAISRRRRSAGGLDRLWGVDSELALSRKTSRELSFGGVEPADLG